MPDFEMSMKVIASKIKMAGSLLTADSLLFIYLILGQFL
jgi:hypothetical protein